MEKMVKIFRQLFSISMFSILALLIVQPQSSTADPLDHWHRSNPLPKEDMITGIAYGNHTFVAVADETVLTSSDGINWIERLSGIRQALYGIIYGHNIFMAIGEVWIAQGDGAILTSSDGINWTMKHSTNYGMLTGATYGNHTFVVVGAGTILTSANGNNWAVKSIGTSFSYFLTGVAYGNNTFVAVGYRGKIMTSANGSKWTEVSIDSDINLYGVTYGNNTFVAVGEYTYDRHDKDHSLILTSSDGVIWTETYSNSYFGSLNGVTYGNNTFVAVGSGGVILSSADGISWRFRYSSSYLHALNGVTYGNNTFVVVGWDGAILQSDPMAPAISADLSLEKTGNPVSVAMGDRLTYKMTITNNGPDAATGVVITDTLPASITFVSATADQGSCSGTSTINCTIGDLTKNATVMVTIVVIPQAAGIIGNTASVAGNEFDANTSDNTATAMTTVNFVLQPLAIGTSVLEAEKDMAYVGSLKINGGLPPYTVSLTKGTLPAGLSLASDNLIGTPLKVGLSTFTLQVTDTLGSSVSKKISLKVLKAVSIATQTLGKGKVGKKYNAILKATAGKKPYSWLLTVGSFPAGLVLDQATGKITGTPTTSGIFPLTFQVTDALGGIAAKSFSLDIK